MTEVREPGAPDDFWWFIAAMADGRTHVYEVGFPYDVQEHDDPEDPEKVTGMHRVSLTEERRAEIMAELGEGLLEAQMAPGRPNRWLEPKQWDANGELLPIDPKPGVTYHPLPGRGDPIEG